MPNKVKQDEKSTWERTESSDRASQYIEKKCSNGNTIKMQHHHADPTIELRIGSTYAGFSVDLNAKELQQLSKRINTFIKTGRL